MNAQDKIAEPRIGNGSLLRPRFTSGQMLQDDDLTQAVDYSRDLNRLLFRSLIGCGVICGLVVTSEEKCGKLYITVAPGVALDACGEAIQVCTAQTIVLDQSCKPFKGPLCVVLRYRERSCSPRSPSCSQDDDASCVSTRINEGYELRIVSGDCPDCGCGCKTRVSDTSATKPTAAETPESSAPTKLLALKKPKAAGTTTPAPTGETPDCSCADPTQDCYTDHYDAICSCCTDCEWVTLARVLHVTLAADKDPSWQIDHSVRHLIRPVLMRDRRAEEDLANLKNSSTSS